MKKKDTPPRYRIVGNYLNPPLESTQTFTTKAAARAENSKWTREAQAQGLIWRGRVKEAEPK